jgi:acyl-CoA thioesterase-1
LAPLLYPFLMRRIVLFLLGVLLLTGCARRAVVPSGDIAFLGDSITAGFGLDPGQAYPALISIPGMTAVNLGVSGSKSDDGLQRLRDYFAGGAHPSLVVIALGANDILRGMPQADTEANLTAAIAECRSRNIPVLLCGMRIPGHYDTDGIFTSVASANHVPLLPDLMQGEQNHLDLLQDDGHPNASGQVVIAQAMQAALLEHFKFPKP